MKSLMQLRAVNERAARMIARVLEESSKMPEGLRGHYLGLVWRGIREAAHPEVVARERAQVAQATKVSELGCDERNEAGAALVAAIRVFTVDMPDGAPNGEAERRVLQLERAIRQGKYGLALDNFKLMCAAFSDNIRALRVAAEHYFGGDFQTDTGDPK